MRKFVVSYPTKHSFASAEAGYFKKHNAHLYGHYIFSKCPPLFTFFFGYPMGGYNLLLGLYPPITPY
jgi:hypothetical protein